MNLKTVSCNAYFVEKFVIWEIYIQEISRNFSILIVFKHYKNP